MLVRPEAPAGRGVLKSGPITCAVQSAPAPPAPKAPKAPRPRPPSADVNAWIDGFYHHYDRIPPRDEIRHAFHELTQSDAEQYLRDAQSRLWNRES